MDSHRMSKTKIYNIYRAMRTRCENPNNVAYKWYGARGISVCERWKIFSNFFEDMGHRPEGMSLDRIDNSKGYSPENCRWANKTQQMRNTRANRKIFFMGDEKSVTEWCSIYNVPWSRVFARLKLGWPFEKALLEKKSTILFPYDKKKKECKRGHPFEGENLIIRKDGAQICRTCRAAQRNKRGW